MIAHATGMLQTWYLMNNYENQQTKLRKSDPTYHLSYYFGPTFLKEGPVDPAQARNGEDASFLDLAGGKDGQALKELRACLGLHLVLVGQCFDNGALGHGLAAGLHGLHALHRHID